MMCLPVSFVKQFNARASAFRIALPTELARVPADERPLIVMQQKRNPLAVPPKPCKNLEARAGAIFARTRKKVLMPENGESLFRWVVRLHGQHFEHQPQFLRS
jgi:hypothetical protein